jgi:hypothetical protein
MAKKENNDDDNNDMSGLVYDTYSSGPTYAKFNAQIVQERHWRCVLENTTPGATPSSSSSSSTGPDRMSRIWPKVSMYRTRTGQMSRFNSLSR